MDGAPEDASGGPARERGGSRHPPARAAKFRQAAFVYLHVGILYECVVWVAGGAGLVPPERGPLILWLALGAAIVALVVWGLWRWQSPWLARIVWVLHAARLPTVVRGAFFAAPGAGFPPELWRTALVVVLVNLWMLARAGWDL